MDLYPLVLSPVFKEYIWGGKKLLKLYPHLHMDSVAESWVLANHREGTVSIQNGAYAGSSLEEFLQKQSRPVVASHLKNELPVLIKLIDSQDILSVQVHPDDCYAKTNESSRGKTEFWYVMDCGEDAFLYYGFKRKISRDEFEKSAADGSILELLDAVKVKPGDTFLIKPGMVHAIGKGITLAEIGTNSNVTYRIFDFFRKDKTGSPRALHMQKAADVSLLESYGRYPYDLANPVDLGPFTIQTIRANGALRLYTAESFHSLLCLEGACGLKWESGCLSVLPGTSIFVPAGLGGYTLEGKALLLKTTI